MTTHTEKLTNEYNELLMMDIEKLSAENKEWYYDTLHRLSIDITKFDIAQLQSVNTQIAAETDNLSEAIDKMTNTAMSDDIYLMLCNAISNSLSILESFLPATM